MHRWIFALAGLLATLPAGAHLMPPGQGAVRFDAAGAFAMVALPATAFTGFDTDGNGRISPAEYKRARDDLQRQLPQVLQLRNGGEPGRVLIVVALLALLLAWRHRENISRLAAGTESRLGQKKASPSDPNAASR